MKTYSSIWVHLIWTTKNRHPLLHKNFRVQLFQKIKTNASEHGYLVDTINGIEDHVHCLLRLLPAHRLSDAVKQMKGFSSHWINQQNYLNVRFEWQTGYGAISVSPSEIDTIRQYIFNQEEHHKKWGLDKEIERFKFFNEFEINRNARK